MTAHLLIERAGALRLAGRRMVALLLAAVVVAGCSQSEPPSVRCGEQRSASYASHAGAPPEQNQLDLYLPDVERTRCQDLPLVVWVHGGAWHEGDKADHVDDKVRLFGDAGYAFASVNYRLTDPDADPPSPQHPVHDQDVADAISWLVGRAEELGIDPERVAVLGHSAGGGIVAAVATDDRYLGAHDLDPGALRCAGSIDGEGYDITVGAEHPDPRVSGPYRAAFGDDPGVWRSASPLHHIGPDQGIPDFFVAARGPEGRLDLHRRLVAALDAAGVPTTVVDARQLDHAQVADDIGAPGEDVVTPALMAFLSSCFAAR